MKNSKLLSTLLFIQIFILSSCSKNETDPIVDATQDTSQETTALITTFENFQEVKKAALESRTQNFQFDAATTGSFTTDTGVTLNIFGSCLQKNGEAITGMVDVEFVELFNKADMLVTNKATMGKNENGDLEILKSGGEFYVNATHNGEQLEITCNMHLMIPTNLTGGNDNDMLLWKGVENPNCPTDKECDAIVWEKEVDNNGNEARVIVEEANGGGIFYTPFGEFGWTNVDRFFNDPRPKTTLQVAVPAGYTDENSTVYLSYDGEANALAQLDVFDDSTNLFSEHYGQIPVGLDCHVIFATEDNGNWLYAIKSVTIAANATITITSSETVTGTEAQLVAAINGLP